MLEIILVRHGETDSNKSRSYLGWTDVELNEEGLRQAYKVKQRLSGEKIDALYSSPLKRAYETARIINQNFNQEIIKVEELKERNFGIWDNLTHNEVVSGYADEYKFWAGDWKNYCMKEGESAIGAYNRVTGFIDRLLGEKKEGRLLVVTHLGCIRKIIAHLLGMGIDGFWRTTVDNGGISRIEVNDDGYTYLKQLNA